MDSLTEIYSQGASKVKMMNAFPSKNIKIELSGASKGYFNLSNARKIDMNLSGASKVELEGVSDSLLLDASGAANIDADRLISKFVEVGLSGASKADVNSSETAKGDVSGASKVNCKGNPKTREISTSGTSKVDYDVE